MGQTIYINELKPGQLISHLQNLPLQGSLKTCLKFETELSADDYSVLAQYIGAQALFPCKLSLTLGKDSLVCPEFLSFIESLSKTDIAGLELHFSEEDYEKHRDEVLQNLTKSIAPRVNYPVHLFSSDGRLHLTGPGDELAEFKKVVIRNIQQRYKGNESALAASSSGSPRDMNPLNTRTIKLKEWIRTHQLASHDLSVFYPVEVQHVETVEQNIVQELQESVELEVHSEAHEIQRYEGKLIDFSGFNKPVYRDRVNRHTASLKLSEHLYGILKTELFANLPEAIKFVSPEAAVALADNLCTFVSINKENLPHGFLLKQTAEGEYVLDYDPYLENEAANEFTPHVMPIEEHPVYEGIKISEVVHGLDRISALELARKLRGVYGISENNDRFPTPLINLWIKYGTEGLQSFFSRLEEATSGCDEAYDPIDAYDFFMDYYLVCLPQWDHLYQDDAFFDCIKTINTYPPKKLNLFKSFIETTGSSRHDLKQTRMAFETLWNEVFLLCGRDERLFNLFLEQNWQHPKGGHPVVYMERLLLILKNARSIEHQLLLIRPDVKLTKTPMDARNFFRRVNERDILIAPEKLSLDNYGAYYASKYEDFKAVSPLILKYDLETCNKKTFNREKPHYRMELDELVKLHVQYWSRANYSDFLQELMKDSFVSSDYLNKKILVSEIPYKQQQKFIKTYLKSACYRHIAMQGAGIHLDDLIGGFEYFTANYSGAINADELLVLPLFFLNHERYSEGFDLNGLFKTLHMAGSQQEDFLENIERLNQLQQLGIKLSPEEGLIIYQSLAGMNSHEFETLNISKTRSANRLLDALQKNRFAVFKYFDFMFKKVYAKWPAIYALDTAEWLAEDPLVAAHYHDDLLLFSGLINNQQDEIYFRGCFRKPKFGASKHPELIKDNLTQVTRFLHLAAERQAPNNLQYAVQCLLNANNFFSYRQFIAACQRIEKIESFNAHSVETILREEGMTLGHAVPTVFEKDDEDLKGVMVSMILRLEQGQTESASAASSSSASSSSVTETGEETEKLSELKGLSVTELQERLQQAWEKAGTWLSLVDKLFLNNILKTILDISIKKAFYLQTATGLIAAAGHQIKSLTDFQDIRDFETLNCISRQVRQLAALVINLKRNAFVKEYDELFAASMSEMDAKSMDSETLHRILFFFNTMPQRNYLKLWTALMKYSGAKEKLFSLLDCLLFLNQGGLPMPYLETALGLEHLPDDKAKYILNQMAALYKNDAVDPVLELRLKHPEMGLDVFQAILEYSEGMENGRDILAQWLNALLENQQLDAVLEALEASKPRHQQIMAIVAKAYALTRSEASVEFDYQELVRRLSQLSEENISSLHDFFLQSPVSLDCLYHAFEQMPENEAFQALLLAFEKAPFGERDLEKQFSLTEVERVINHSKDMANGSVHRWQYRKQMMEAFLFVNEIGNSLPVYYNKPARALSHAEIKSFFTNLKNGESKGLRPFQRRLLALGLIREAIYRSTGEFPYSTQMIALIDGMMHQGDFISNIDTGQGKSMVDSMKAALLWLDSDRVDFTTSSLVDSRRDISQYGAFFSLLDIPYSQKPISSLSPLEDFQTEGVNFSTFGQLSLFFAKARVDGHILDNKDTRVSLVANESDYAVLDDRVIYRFASNEGLGIGQAQQWIYQGINEFVTRYGFTQQQSNAAQDIQGLKQYLAGKAKHLKKSARLIEKFDDEQYLTWLESALMVNFVLKENVDYVIPEETETRQIAGKSVQTRVVKLLMKDGKVSPDASFGNGIQQLLYAKLNAEADSNDFIIEPQNKTIISSNNKNLIDYYRSRKGFIWGSSGTVGSESEIDEQYAKYGFEFSRLEPHQANKVAVHSPIVKANQSQQLACLSELLAGDNDEEKQAPSLVFCKDIETARLVHSKLAKTFSHCQLYTGLGREEDIINQAKTPGMITVTTSALGRNTDIHYDRAIGLRVFHTHVDAVRAIGQKSGRTGRQGSAGEVHYIFNEAELNGQDIETIQHQLDEQARRTRQVNEWLYNLLGYLMSRIDECELADKPLFLKKYWSKFSKDTETCFRESRLEDDFSEEKFIENTLADFRQMMMGTSLEKMDSTDVQAFFEVEQSQKPQYSPYDEAVTINQCVLPVHIAYQMMNLKLEPANPVTKDEIKAQLTILFENIPRVGSSKATSQYLDYINSNPAKQAIIIEAHQEFVDNLLATHSEGLSFVQQWFGTGRRLSHITDTTGYLLMFQAFAEMDDEGVVKLDRLKESIRCLLHDYLDTGWFINDDRKLSARQLVLDVSNAQSLHQVIDRLCREQIKIAELDLETNRHRFFKPLHFSGQSRYQNTMSRALKLISALSGERGMSSLNKGMASLLDEGIHGLSENEQPAEPLTMDELKNKSLQQAVDPCNVSVIAGVIENALTIQHRGEPKGMEGRSTLNLNNP